MNRRPSHTTVRAGLAYGGSEHTHQTGASIIRWVPFVFAAEACSTHLPYLWDSIPISSR